MSNETTPPPSLGGGSGTELDVTTPPRLELSSISRSFGAVCALRDVSLRVAPGEIRGLCGHNGAGKSTLINIVAGLIAPDAGAVSVDGAQVQFSGPRDAQANGIAWVDQELSMVPSLTIVENLALGSGGLGLLRSRARERASASEQLEPVGLAHRQPDELVANLSLGERQLVEIARALSRGARLLILDEPTATLTDLEIERVFNAVRRVAADGCSVIFVSHRLREVLDLCDSVTVMRDGKVVTEARAAALTASGLVEAMLGEQPARATADKRENEGEVVLSVRGLSVSGRVHGFSHDFRAGHVYGVAGQVGAGASELLRALAGLMPTAQGEVRVLGAPLNIRHPVRARRSGLGFVANDRKSEGLFLGRSVAENLTVTRLREISHFGLLSPRAERARAHEIAEYVHVAADRVEHPVGLLSGGNQQKAFVGRYVLDQSVRVLLVDEPTRGVDVGGRAAIHDLLTNAAREGLTVIFATSDLEELLELATTVITMRAGHVVGVYANDVSHQTVLADLTHRDGAESAEQVA
ncbi:MAG: sugar ABC transporter ATP-binding protein [Solirubrobacteraceae bacterium]